MTPDLLGFLVVKTSTIRLNQTLEHTGCRAESLLAHNFECDVAMVSEGRCPYGHGDLWRVPIAEPMASDDTGGEAGWCGRCRRGYVARRHRHTEVCAGPNMDEAEYFCAYETGDPTIAWYAPEALLLYEVPTPRLPEDIRC